jgi:hypothetical protein
LARQAERWEKLEWAWAAAHRERTASGGLPVWPSSRSTGRVYPNTRDFATDSIYSRERRTGPEGGKRPKTRSTSGVWEIPPATGTRRELESGRLGEWFGGRQLQRPSTAGTRRVPFNYHWQEEVERPMRPASAVPGRKSAVMSERG